LLWVFRNDTCAETALDAAPTVALCASSEDRAAASGSRVAPSRVRHTRGGPAGARGVRLADQHIVRGADQPHHPAACGRGRSSCHPLCKGIDGLRQQLSLFQTYHNFCLPHASLRQPLPQPLPTEGTGSAKHWRPCTPAMAAGLTAHVWSLREASSCKFFGDDLQLRGNLLGEPQLFPLLVEFHHF
jgi:hypothetical protein